MRKQHSAAFKATVVVEALREAKTVAQIAAEHQIHPTLVTKWKSEALAGLTAHFQRDAAKEEKTQAQERKIAELYQEIGRLTTQVNWLKKKSGLEPDAL
jgi:putative transposase